LKPDFELARAQSVPSKSSIAPPLRTWSPLHPMFKLFITAIAAVFAALGVAAREKGQVFNL